jgi:hypothetical protein
MIVDALVASRRTLLLQLLPIVFVAVAHAAFGAHAAAQVQVDADVSAGAPASACAVASGRVLTVGPDKSYALPSAAAAVAQTGDVIRISAGDYRGDVATWTASNLTICAVGGRARLFADGTSAQGKAIWVIAGADAVVEGIEFHGVHVPDRNGAGIRAEGRNLTVRNSGFFDSDEGMLGGEHGTIVIERCEFARNGFGDGQSHNLYIGRADKLVVTASFFHEAKVGHNFKSRAKETRVENSYFMDGPSGTSSYLIDAPNGGVVVLRGNLFHKGPNADNPTAIAYGQEGLRWTTNTLELIHNTVVMTYGGGSFIVAPAGTQSVKLTANLLAGRGGPRLIGGGVPSDAITQQNNVTAAASSFFDADNVAAPNFWPNASLQARLALPSVLDATYAEDSPQPFTRRALGAPARRAGALQRAR